MSTGYTYCIEEGASFKEFILRCARGMGACIMQRDEDSDAPPKIQEPSDYHKKEIEKIEQELISVSNMSKDDIEAKVNTINMCALSDFEKNICDNSKKIEKYRVMLNKVRAWKPPTKDHEQFKNFMIEQIESSIKFDDMGTYYKNNTPKKIKAEDWVYEKKVALLKDLEYHKRENAKEIERVEERNNWIKELYKSLEGVE